MGIIKIIESIAEHLAQEGVFQPVVPPPTEQAVDQHIKLPSKPAFHLLSSF